MTSPVELDPWAKFRVATRARVGLGRCGDALPTKALLDFQLAHARARDSVHGIVDFEALALTLAPLPTIKVHSAAPDRATYLRRPDLGRCLAEADRSRLTEEARSPKPDEPWDAVFVVGDGLSAAAVNTHAAALVHTVQNWLPGWRFGPVVLAEQARVALGDDIGGAMGARLVAVLIGERPGLSSSDSLGVYMTYGPHVGRLESERNCISNIHGAGLAIETAADTLAWLMTEALRRKLSGVDLKEDAASTLPSMPEPTALPLSS